MRPSRQWRFRLEDILARIHRIQSHIAGMSFDEFQVDQKTIDAVERNFITIGEASANIPDEVIRRFPDVPWRKMRDMRNVVVHRYWGIELDTIWDTVQNDLPPLIPLIERVLTETTD